MASSVMPGLSLRTDEDAFLYEPRPPPTKAKDGSCGVAIAPRALPDIASLSHPVVRNPNKQAAFRKPAVPAAGGLTALVPSKSTQAAEDRDEVARESRSWTHPT